MKTGGMWGGVRDRFKLQKGVSVVFVIMAMCDIVVEENMYIKTTCMYVQFNG